MLSNHRSSASSIHHHLANDENGVAAANAAKNHHHAADSTLVGKKTPAPSGGDKQQQLTNQRRAFGDISNRKQTARTGAAAPPPLNNNNGSKSVTFGSATTAVAKTPFAPRLTAGLKKSSSKNQHLDSWGNRKEGVNTKPSGSFILDESLDDANGSILLEEVADIELPAGRTWKEQQALHPFDDDDGTVVSLEGAATARQDLLKLLAERHERELRWKDEDHQRCLDALDRRVADFVTNTDGTSPCMDQCSCLSMCSANIYLIDNTSTTALYSSCLR